MTRRRFLLNHKYLRIINLVYEKTGITRRKVIEMLFKSDVYADMETGLGEMHCRSDGYLADEILRELDEKGTNSPQV
ncbi:MAG: hypothetical protein LBM41_08390 [Ruminococcus sp.]|jgi:hypothetical protein|nr:hypothetical protein [Ruminococcus sp.]